MSDLQGEYHYEQTELLYYYACTQRKPRFNFGVEKETGARFAVPVSKL